MYPLPSRVLHAVASSKEPRIPPKFSLKKIVNVVRTKTSQGALAFKHMAEKCSILFRLEVQHSVLVVTLCQNETC